MGGMGETRAWLMLDAPTKFCFKSVIRSWEYLEALGALKDQQPSPPVRLSGLAPAMGPGETGRTGGLL